MTFDLPLQTFWALPLASLRALAMLMSAPVFGHAAVQVRIRVAMAVLLSLAIVPLDGPRLDALATPLEPSIAAIGWLVAQELMIGFALGFGLRVLFDLFAPLGELISVQGGLGAAMVLDPTSSASSPVFGVLLQNFALVVFLAVDGHHAVLRGLASSFERLPIGGPGLSADHFGLLAGLGASVFEVTARLAAPVTAVMLVLNVAIGILGRAIPQLNLMAVQLPANIAIVLAMLALCAGPLAGVLSETLTGFTDQVFGIVLGNR